MRGIELYAHDADGRLASMTRDGVTRTLAYSAEGPLVRVSGGPEGTVTYAANGVGYRSTSTSSTGARRLVVASPTQEGLPQTHAVVDGAGAVVRRFVHAGGRPLMRIDGAVPEYYLEDGLGSVIGVANSAGDLAGRVDYDGLGNIRASSGAMAGTGAVGGDYRFHGAWLEGATGLYHVHAREYDARTGRFLSRDPAEPDLMMPETMHPYAFAASNPMLYWDLDGRTFDLISLNLSVSMQDISRAVQGAAQNAIKDYARDKIEGIGMNLLESAIGAMLPEAAAVADLIQGGDLTRQDQGNFFDQIVKEGLCSMIGSGSWDSRLWLAPSINPRTGQPTGNGLNCSPNGSADVGDGSRPDFLFSKYTPRRLGIAGQKSYLIGEVKLARRTLAREMGSRQIRSMIEHAKHYQYVPGMLLISLEGDDDRESTRIIRLGLERQGVIPVLMSLR